MGIRPTTSKVEAAQEVAKSWFQVFQDVHNNLAKAHSWQKQQADRCCLTAPSYSIGSQSHKLSEKWIRLYEVLEVLLNTLKLKLPCNMRIHLVMNVSWVKPYLSALDGQPVNRPGLQRVTDEGDVKYKVDYVVDSHLKCGALQFLIHWRGYPEEDCTWEPASTLKNLQLAIKDFY
ncbi:hypothetical protein M404DRAFT_151818 [Pisolithus tinctorius Marx 270]|uniref:Chromo domain-containing protein n=1 Tax=Pisolithus tinctorius Marx 270 TaxID=870435 RepID=A0A0C3NZY6_PISTI|nr:hypothetical protein M404DRAFT_151818 [Pisolithus tinctorius Marx 270]